MAHEDAEGPAALLLTATVARRYYLDGANKSEIAAELGLSRFKVARLLDHARATGLVRIELDDRGEIDLDLSRAAPRGPRRCATAWSSTRPRTTAHLLRAALGRAAAESADRDRPARRRPRAGLGADAAGDALVAHRGSRPAPSCS